MISASAKLQQQARWELILAQTPLRLSIVSRELILGLEFNYLCNLPHKCPVQRPGWILYTRVVPCACACVSLFLLWPRRTRRGWVINTEQLFSRIWLKVLLKLLTFHPSVLPLPTALTPFSSPSFIEHICRSTNKHHVYLIQRQGSLCGHMHTTKSCIHNHTLTCKH